jgi:two-component system sensor histidine kinase YesM
MIRKYFAQNRNKRNANNIQNSFSIFRFRTYRSLFFYRLGIIILLFVLLFFFVYSSYSLRFRNHTYDHIKSTMELYNDQSTQNLKNVTTYLIENSYLNTDITSINVTQDINQQYTHAARIKQLLSYTLDSFSQIDGIFFYSPVKDIFIKQTHSGQEKQMDNLNCSAFILNTLRTHKNNKSFKELEVTKWHIVEINNTHFIIRYIKINNSYSGAWVNVDTFFSSFDYFTKLDASLLYIDEDGHALNDSRFFDYQFPSKSKLKDSSIIKDENGVKYLAISQELGYCDYYIMALIPFKNINKQLFPLYSMLAILILILVALSMSMMLTAYRLINLPLNLLKPVIHSLRNGEFDSKIPAENYFRETQDLINTLNDMIERIQDLRINIYEEKILKKEIELQYLKSQVSPHFLINCLNTIFVLSNNLANQDLMYKIIHTLSNHLRYTLSNKTSTSLKEEIKFVENYILLMQHRFPDCIDYQIDISKEIEDATVFPLILLMLTENSINSNVVMGESFSIYIKAYSYDSDEKKRVHIQHIDSGTGFNEQKLDIFNHITQYPKLRKSGHNIGIYNTVMRLKLVLGDSASIQFSNEPGLGARVDIDIPYVAYVSEDPQE